MFSIFFKFCIRNFCFLFSLFQNLCFCFINKAKCSIFQVATLTVLFTVCAYYILRHIYDFKIIPSHACIEWNGSLMLIIHPV